MPIEVASNISELDDSYPLGGDPTNKGDDHLRLIKYVLKTQFPGALGQGYDTPILATEAELNYLQGATSNIQNQINALQLSVETTLHAPSGTILSFFQLAAPTGWTQIVVHNDAMMRVVSAAGGGSGGSDSSILMDKIPGHTHVATAANNGTHSHSHRIQVGSINTVFSGAGNAFQGGSSFPIGATGSNIESAGDHTHTITVNTNAGAANWTPKYVDMILASKD